MFFVIFPFWLPKLSIFDLRFGFLVENCIYSQLDRSRIPKFGQKMQNIFFNMICLKYDHWVMAILQWAEEILQVNFDKILGPVFDDILALDVYQGVTRTFFQAPRPFLPTFAQVFCSSRGKSLPEKKNKNL